MTPHQESVLKELIGSYFSGGNASQWNQIVIKEILESIAVFVKENFKA